MKEETVTKHILRWLMDNGWTIVCYDFPQNGTGRFLHPNDSTSKNQDSINPDIVAVKGKKCVFFENKDRFYYPDFEKINKLRTGNDYSNAIDALLKNYDIECIHYGIGFPAQVFSRKATEAEHMADFVIGVEEDGKINKLYLRGEIDFFDT
jgi:hypothetical protein